MLSCRPPGPSGRERRPTSRFRSTLPELTSVFGVVGGVGGPWEPGGHKMTQVRFCFKVKNRFWTV